NATTSFSVASLVCTNTAAAASPFCSVMRLLRSWWQRLGLLPAECVTPSRASRWSGNPVAPQTPAATRPPPLDRSDAPARQHGTGGNPATRPVVAELHTVPQNGDRDRTRRHGMVSRPPAWMSPLATQRRTHEPQMNG